MPGTRIKNDPTNPTRLPPQPAPGIMTVYRVYLIEDDTGLVAAAPHVLQCANDDEALEKAM